MLEGDSPKTTYFLDYDNPWEKRLGPEQRKEIDKTLHMNAFISVRVMVQHIYKGTKKLFAGTDWEDARYFYHGHLKKLMTTTEEIACMKAEGIYQHWMVPEMGICNNIPQFSVHYDGNQVEKMPPTTWASGFARSCHASLSSPKRCAPTRMVHVSSHWQSCCWRYLSLIVLIFDPKTGIALTSMHIVKYIDTVFENVRIIFNNKGVHASGLANRSGHRKIAGYSGKGQWGGKRQKKAGNNFLLCLVGWTVMTMVSSYGVIAVLMICVMTSKACSKITGFSGPLTTFLKKKIEITKELKEADKDEGSNKKRESVHYKNLFPTRILFCIPP